MLSLHQKKMQGNFPKDKLLPGFPRFLISTMDINTICPTIFLHSLVWGPPAIFFWGKSLTSSKRNQQFWKWWKMPTARSIPRWREQLRLFSWRLCRKDSRKTHIWFKEYHLPKGSHVTGIFTYTWLIFMVFMSVNIPVPWILMGFQIFIFVGFKSRKVFGGVAHRGRLRRNPWKSTATSQVHSLKLT